jgi:hypothetical protein
MAEAPSAHDRKIARRNYILFCVTGTLAMTAFVVAAIVFVNSA